MEVTSLFVLNRLGDKSYSFYSVSQRAVGPSCVLSNEASGPYPALLCLIEELLHS